MKKLQSNQNGIAHLGLILAVVAVVAVGVFAYVRVQNSNKASLHTGNQETADQLQTLPENLTDIKTLAELEQIAGVDSSTSIIKFVLENDGGTNVYKVVLSNGRKLVINATTGAIISEETVDVSGDEQLPAGVKINITPAQAYAQAASRSSSPIKSIELEVEDKKVVYKIEYKDGSKIEIDATTGAVIKAEIKDESEDDEDEDEDKDEDQEDEDEDKDEDQHEDEDKPEDRQDEDN